MRFQVLTAASMKFKIVFWDVLPCKIIVDRRFRGAYCLQQHPSPLKRRSTIILHGSTSQKTILNFSIIILHLPSDFIILINKTFVPVFRIIIHCVGINSLYPATNLHSVYSTSYILAMKCSFTFKPYIFENHISIAISVYDKTVYVCVAYAW
jgi:hypothetical protein